MKTKKFFVALVALFMGSQVMVFAQQDKKEGRPERKQPTKEQMQEMLCNRIINELALDDSEAAKFSPVYKKYMEELAAARGDEAPRPGKGKPGEAKEGVEEQTPAMPTDAEVEAAIKARFEQERKILDIRESYYTEFRKVLSAKQILKMYNMEKRNDRRAPQQGMKQGGQRGPQQGMQQGPQQGMQPGGHRGGQQGGPQECWETQAEAGQE